jgi:thiosulfate dehydrogenase [quinone] large subunit
VVSTYHYYRGSVVTPFHPGPVSASKHHVTLTDAVVRGDGGVSFHAYLDGGTPAVPAHIVRIVLRGPDGRAVETWNGTSLGALPKSAFSNDYRYNKFGPGLESIQAGVGSKATIALPAVRAGLQLAPGRYALEAITIDANRFTTGATLGATG